MTRRETGAEKTDQERKARPALSRRLLGGIPNKRAALAVGLSTLGVVRRLERWAKRQGPFLVVLTYHRIAEPATDLYYEPVISATPAGFARQLDALRRHYRILSLGELIQRFEPGDRDSTERGASPRLRLDGPSALITFDDGYRDNAEIAAPILQERGIPATFFLVSGFLEAPRLPWWDHVAFVLKQTLAKRFTIEFDQGAPLPVDLTRASRREALMAVIHAVLEGRVGPGLESERRFLGQLDSLTGVAVDSEARGRSLFLSPEQARDLAAQGIAVGSHTHSHRRLADLAETDQRAELAGSRHRLEQVVGREVETLAYPYGGPTAYSPTTIRLTAEAGYRLAFTARPGVMRSSNAAPLEIQRLNIGTGDTPALLLARTALLATRGSSFL
jgi:peptidoglycan/xylan/chitin deacetylase (PgdA/CDA1 family)